MKPSTRYVDKVQYFCSDKRHTFITVWLGVGQDCKWYSRSDAVDLVLLQANAVSTFNILNQEGRKVAGVLLPAGSS